MQLLGEILLIDWEYFLGIQQRNVDYFVCYLQINEKTYILVRVFTNQSQWEKRLRHIETTFLHMCQKKRNIGNVNNVTHCTLITKQTPRACKRRTLQKETTDKVYVLKANNTP